MSVSASDWSKLLFGGRRSGCWLAEGVWSGGRVALGDGDPAAARVCKCAGAPAEGARVLCAVSGGGAVYVLSEVGS